MNVKVLERSEKSLKIEVSGDGYSLCNLIQEGLLEDPSVEIAGYHRVHPLSDSFVIYLRVKEGDPDEAILRAVERVRERLTELQSIVGEALGGGEDADKGS